MGFVGSTNVNKRQIYSLGAITYTCRNGIKVDVEDENDDDITTMDIIVIIVYFSVFCGPAVLAGCLFCYACKDSERKRKAHEEKKR